MPLCQSQQEKTLRVFVDFRYHAFLYILTSLQAISTTQRSPIPNIVSIVKVVLVSGATTATPERSFLWLEELKHGYGQQLNNGNSTHFLF